MKAAVSIADATLASPQRTISSWNGVMVQSFNRRRDACFPATKRFIPLSCQFLGFNRRRDACFPATCRLACRRRSFVVSIADATLASPQRILRHGGRPVYTVSIADATLASPQRAPISRCYPPMSAVSIADATLASPQLSFKGVINKRDKVSIADATLASPQLKGNHFEQGFDLSFNRRRDACFPATFLAISSAASFVRFQSQTRRLLPRNMERSLS